MFNDFPRSMMLGHQLSQWIVHDKQVFDDIIEEHNGKQHIWTSVNHYPGHNGKVKDVQRVGINKLFIDLDHKTKPENSHGDAKEIVGYTEEHDIPTTYRWSGLKGFSVFFHYDPAVYEIAGLREYYRAIYYRLRDELGLRTLDMNCAEAKRLCRVTNTLHVKADLYCIPLTADQVMSMTIEEIKELAKEQQPEPEPPAGIEKFADFCTRLDIDPSYTAGLDRAAGYSKYAPPQTRREKWITKMWADPCVSGQLITNHNPPHGVRLAMAIHMANMAEVAPIQHDEHGEEFIIAPDVDYVDAFYEQARYDDVGNSVKRRQYIDHIFRRGYKYPGCNFLYNIKKSNEIGAETICVGSSCPKWARYIKPYVQDMD